MFLTVSVCLSTRLHKPGLARYISAIYIGDTYPIYIRYFRVRKYPIFPIFSKLDIFHIFSTLLYYKFDV